MTPVYTFMAIFTPRNSYVTPAYTCIYTICTPNTPLNTLCTPYVHPMYTNIPLYTLCTPFSETLCRPNGATPLRLLPHSPRRRHHDGRAGAGMVLATARGHCGEAGCCMGAAVCRALLGGKATASAKAVGGGATGRVCEGPVPASY